MPFVTCSTGMVVALESSDGRRLLCSGSRCCTRTKPIPVSVGRCLSNSVNASNPPADAPTPTTGNSFRGTGPKTFEGFFSEVWLSESWGDLSLATLGLASCVPDEVFGIFFVFLRFTQFSPETRPRGIDLG